MKIIAVIPAYNEERTIRNLVKDTKKEVSEVIVVNDGSRDSTAKLAKDSDAVVIHHEINRGYGKALRTGFKRALVDNANVVVLLDADAQHNPEEIEKVVEPIIDDKSDVVIGSRFLGHVKIPFYRRFGIKIITFLIILLTGLKITDAQSGFRAFSKDALKYLKLKDDGMGISIEVLFKISRLGLRITEVPISCQYEKIVHKINPVIHGYRIFYAIFKQFFKNL